MLARQLAVVCLVVIPSLASAQRGGGGGGSGAPPRGEKQANWDKIGKDANAGVKLSNGDVEDMSPIKLLIDKRKDLKLSDAQLKQIKDLESSLKTKNADLFKALDSLRRDTKSATAPTDEERARMMSARRSMTETVGTIRINYDAALKDAMALLDDSQKKTATELTEKQTNESNDTVREKLGGRGGA